MSSSTVSSSQGEDIAPTRDDDASPALAIEKPTFREMFDETYAYVRRVLRRLGVAPSDVDDAAQEVFAAAHGKWGEFDPSRPLRPWLFSFAFRVAANWRRRAKRAPAESSDEAELVDPRSPEQAVLEQETRALVLSVLERMPFERRDVFVMHDIEGLEAKKVAEILGIPTNTVYSRLRVAREDFEAGLARARRRAT